jgi:WD40 repeat protein
MARLLIGNVAWAGALFWFSGLASDLPHSAASSQLTLKEEFIGEKSPAALIMERLQDTISPDGQHVAWREKRGTGWLYMLDGAAEGRGYDELLIGNFSPDSRLLAYWARTGKTWTVVIGQKEEGAYSDSGSSIVFSSDSAHHAYWVSGEQWKKHFIVSDSVSGPRFDDVDRPFFSPKTQRLIYSATRGKASIIVDNGQETPRKLRSRVYGFTPEEKLILLEEEPGRGTKRRYAFGAEVGPWFDAFSPVVFGATDDRFAYAGARIRWGGLFNWTITQGDNQANGQVIVDGLAGSTYKGEELVVASGSSFWKPPRFENVIASGTGRFSAPMHGVSAPVISPDGRHIAYTARVTKDHYAVMLDGQEIDSFEYTACDPAFSPSGELYYAGFRAKNFVVTGNGKILSQLPAPEKKEYGQYGCYAELKPPAHFITRLIWQADIGWRGRIFVDGSFGPEQVMGGQFDIQFSGDRFHTVFKVDEQAAKTNRSYIVLDGLEGKSFDEILGRFPPSVHFTSEGEVTFIARSGTKIIRVTQARSVDESIR